MRRNLSDLPLTWSVVGHLKKLPRYGALRVQGLMTLAVLGAQSLPGRHFWPGVTTDERSAP